MKHITANNYYLVQATDDLGTRYMWLLDTEPHRIPDWMPLQLHLKLERIISLTPKKWLNNKPLAYLYHLLHGLTCAYTLKQIRTFNKKTTNYKL
jgi:hypothetical protein